MTSWDSRLPAQLADYHACQADTPGEPVRHVVWAFHPFAALRRVSQISASRLRSVPLHVIDWTGAGSTAGPLPGDASLYVPGSALVVVPDEQSIEAGPDTDLADTAKRAGRRPVPDEFYAAQLRELVTATGVVPSAREVARLLSVGQDRARRLVTMMSVEQDIPRSS